MKILNHVIEFHTRAKNRFKHFKVHRHETYKHVCWWRFSLIYGQPHLMPMIVCANCFEETREIRAGDEGWTYCEGCSCVEPDTLEVTTEEWERHHG